MSGGGEPKTLRIVAQYSDATNLIVSCPEEAKAKLSVPRGTATIWDATTTIEKTVQRPRPTRSTIPTLS